MNSSENARTNPRSSNFRHYHDEDESGCSTPSLVSPRESQFGIHADPEQANASPHSESHPWLARALRRIPDPVRQSSRRVLIWVKGPQPPRTWIITPFFPKVQTAPIKLLNQWLPQQRHRITALIAFYLVYLICFLSVLKRSAFSSEVPGYGSPATISCTSTWWAPKNYCGLNGDDCRPFENSSFAFRCPGNCLRTHVLNPHAVGSGEVIYQPLVIGGARNADDTIGTGVYRGDSFICASAIHAGFISNAEGGCGVVSIVGEAADFPSTKQHGIESTAFDSNFPLAMKFEPGTRAKCEDLRWPLLVISLIFTCILSIFTTHPGVFFWSIFSGIFFHVALVSDPPNLSNYYSLVSNALGRFLPAAFVGFVLYKYCVKRVLEGLEAQVEKTILWLGAFWVGALNNYTFDRIPIQRLTPHDLRQQSGAVPALIGVVLGILVIAIGQAWAIRVEGRMPRYLAVYGIFVLSLLMLVAVPHMNLRIHHYILALLLVPGTAMQNRPSLLWQGLLIGLFVNGIARWGFDSILQTPGELRGDAQLGSALPGITSPIISRDTISFDFSSNPPPDSFDGVSVLVNDVERYRGYSVDGDLNFTWHRSAPEGDPEYFRFGYMAGTASGDYTKAGVWDAEGDWIDMPAGPSR
ncbi:MAG: hypothetical protein M1828_006171 [Chrysothrix sp. TS-e1954]|nr:MAG: hypothetical protein M1828_006171 [Chrysothrix sp. TS-e1954]